MEGKFGGGGGGGEDINITPNGLLEYELGREEVESKSW